MDGVAVSATASSVMLKSEANWTHWISSIENIADTYHVWDVCDPELPEEQVQFNLIVKPVRPHRPLHPSRVPGAQPDEADDPPRREKVTYYQDELDEYDRDYKAWIQQDTSLIAIGNQIIARLDVSHHTLINGAGFSSPYAKLVKLKEIFGRTSARPYESWCKWSCMKMVGPPKRAMGLQAFDRWYEAWNKQRIEVIGYKIETKELHPLAFIHAVKDVDRIWWQSRFEDVRDNYKAHTVENLAASLRATLAEYHQTTSSTSPSQAAFATNEPTLQGQTQQQKKRTDQPSNKTGQSAALRAKAKEV
ncbi:uncharacterized protein N7483_003319 [Penicillium malachiteum]|uniref:uncharacterized protein n=1 Tax=Penicillium malachiteum TaxID=1324776 RepID=UPI0025488AAB|nr:uncharacterized protein N7483_003319 [Penicillium malachiteum]KAJ5728811.1 hypothetical protein N7483_003319 [Penicillium malachiteum]